MAGIPTFPGKHCLIPLQFRIVRLKPALQIASARPTGNRAGQQEAVADTPAHQPGPLHEGDCEIIYLPPLFHTIGFPLPIPG